MQRWGPPIIRGLSKPLRPREICVIQGAEEVSAQEPNTLPFANAFTTWHMPLLLYATSWSVLGLGVRRARLALPDMTQKRGHGAAKPRCSNHNSSTHGKPL